jgi:hypothetical protein
MTIVEIKKKAEKEKLEKADFSFKNEKNREMYGSYDVKKNRVTIHGIAGDYGFQDFLHKKYVLTFIDTKAIEDAKLKEAKEKEAELEKEIEAERKRIADQEAADKKAAEEKEIEEKAAADEKFAKESEEKLAENKSAAPGTDVKA